MENKILKGKIVSQQIEIFTEGMQVAYWQDGILGYRGWAIGKLVVLPKLIGNGEILAVIYWGEYLGVSHSCSVFHLKQFVIQYEPIRPPSKFFPSLHKYLPHIYESNGEIKNGKLVSLPLKDSHWTVAHQKEYVDMPVDVDFRIKEVGTGEINPDYEFEKTPIAELVNI